MLCDAGNKSKSYHTSLQKKLVSTKGIVSGRSHIFANLSSWTGPLSNLHLCWTLFRAPTMNESISKCSIPSNVVVLPLLDRLAGQWSHLLWFYVLHSKPQQTAKASTISPNKAPMVAVRELSSEKQSFTWVAWQRAMTESTY